MLTANAFADQREMFLSKGINDFLSKPIEMQKLDVILSKWVPEQKQIKVSIDKKRLGKSLADNMPQMQGVDAETGLKNTGGFVPTYKNILAIYCKDANERIPQIKQAEQSGDVSLYVTLVHAMKSASRSIGAIDIGNIAANLQEAGENKNWNYIYERTDQFLEQLKMLTVNISEALSIHAERKTDAPVLEYVYPDWTQLKDALLKMEIGTINKIISDYSQLPLDDETRTFVSEIEQNVLMFEYDKAIELIDGALH
jgi:HPt (histidine-containing phosphotransfer) domain-containing protein